MATRTEQEPADVVRSLQRKVEEYERWFRFLDGQNRVLERERQKLSAVFNHTDAGFLVFDSALKVVWANEVFSSRFGAAFEPGEIPGAACHKILCGRENVCEDCPVTQSFAGGEMAHREIQAETGDGSRFIYLTAMPIKSPYGDTEEALAMVQDVSDLEVLRRSREALVDCEERYALLLGAGGAVPWRMDPVTLVFTEIGGEAVRLLGHTAGAWCAPGFLGAHLHPDDRDRVIDFLRGATAGAEAQAREFRMIAVDGRMVRLRTVVKASRRVAGKTLLLGVMSEAR